MPNTFKCYKYLSFVHQTKISLKSVRVMEMGKHHVIINKYECYFNKTYAMSDYPNIQFRTLKVKNLARALHNIVQSRQFVFTKFPLDTHN